MSSPSFWQNFGQGFGNYAASRSPLGAALFRGITGKDPTSQQLQSQNLQNQPDVAPRYQGPTPAMTTTAPQQPTQPQQGPVTAPVRLPTPDNSSVMSKQTHQAVSFGNPVSPSLKVSVAGSGGFGGYAPGGAQLPNGTDGPMEGGYPWPTTSWPGSDGQGTPTGSGGGIVDWSPMEGNGTGGDGYGWYPSDEGSGDSFPDSGATGGVMGHPQTMRVGEAGPEMAGGKIITSPTLVALKKGESVIPLNPSADSKLTPNLIDGHTALPKSHGMQYSRYKSNGQGRG